MIKRGNEREGGYTAVFCSIKNTTYGTILSSRTRSHTPGCFSLTTLPSHRTAMSLGPRPNCRRRPWQRRAGEKRSGSTPRPQTPSCVSHPSTSTFRFMNSVCDGKYHRAKRQCRGSRHAANKTPETDVADNVCCAQETTRHTKSQPPQTRRTSRNSRSEPNTGSVSERYPPTPMDMSSIDFSNQITVKPANT